MNDRIVPTPRVYKPTGYTQAVRAGNTLYIAGQVPYDKDGNLIGVGDIRAQAEQVFSNLQAVLEDAGGSLHDIVKMTTLLTDARFRPTFREVRARYFGDYLPPNTMHIVQGLAEPEFLVEVEAIAVLRDSEGG